MDEYKYTCETHDFNSENLPFIFFCFLRKNLALNVNLKVVGEYINCFWTETSYEDLTKTNAYRNFLENFFSGSFKVSDSKNNSTK